MLRGRFESQNKVQEITNIQEEPALTVLEVDEAVSIKKRIYTKTSRTTIWRQNKKEYQKEKVKSNNIPLLLNVKASSNVSLLNIKTSSNIPLLNVETSCNSRLLNVETSSNLLLLDVETSSNLPLLDVETSCNIPLLLDDETSANNTSP
ncbi:23341_t:CDS:2, partial [Racocetra persica]